MSGQGTSDGGDLWVRLGAVGRAHGLRGEFRLGRSISDGESVIADLAEVGLLSPAKDAKERQAELRREALDVREIEKVRIVNTGVLIKLAGVPDRTAAEALRGTSLWAPRESLPEPDEDEWYVADLIGLVILDAEEESLGYVHDVATTAAHDLLICRGPRGEVMIPLVPEIVRDIDLEARRILVELPEGLLELAT